MSEFQYCPYCAQELQPFQDEERLRLRCPACGWVNYRNPTVGVAVIVLEAGCILLGERRDGGWCIPCGHVEWDESIEQAAIREFAEETGLLVSLETIFAVQSNFHNPGQHTVGVWYLGGKRTGSLHPGGDLVQVAFFSLDALPDLKFPTDLRVIDVLKQPGSSGLLHPQAKADHSKVSQDPGWRDPDCHQSLP